MLKEDHQKVQQIFQQFENAKDSPDRMKALSDQAIVELQIHSMLEEELFYPAMRRGQETEEILNEAEEEHHVADLLMDEIMKMKPSDSHYHAKFMVLAENVKHHIREEETEMLPKARQLLGIRYEEVGDQMMQRKQKLVTQFGGKPRSMTRTSRGGTSGATGRSTSGTRSRTGSRSTTSRSTARGTSRSGTRASTGTRARSTTSRKATTRSRSK
jgi:hypothetical protein